MAGGQGQEAASSEGAEQLAVGHEEALPPRASILVSPCGVKHVSVPGIDARVLGLEN